MRSWYKQGEALLHEIAAAAPASNEVIAWYIGQEGYVFKGEKTVCVDPFLNDLLDDRGQSLRHYDPPFAPASFAPDYVVCTHGHVDHMALPTLTAMAGANSVTHFIVPAGCVDELAGAGVARDRIHAMQAHETLTLPGLVIRPVQAAHPVHEVDAQGRDLALCLDLRMNGVELLHLGDTYLTDQLLADLKALPKPDVFLSPINGGDYYRTSQNIIGNLSPLEAARLATILHAGVSIPMHFDLLYPVPLDPILFLQHLWSEDPAARFRMPALGEQLRFRAE